MVEENGVQKLSLAVRGKYPHSEFSDRYFPAFRLNTEIYRVSLRIQFQ